MRLKKNLKIHDIEETFKDRPAGTEEGFKFFSVLVPVVERQGRLYLMYELRAKHMSRQPGEICFPGGEMEGRESPEECALRETREEVGISPEKIRIINRLDTIYTYSNFAMYCCLGVMEETALEEIRLNPDEVEEIFFISLDELMETDPEIYNTEVIPRIPGDFPYEKVTGGKPYNWRRGRAIVPVYDIDGRIIWGLTARITRRFLEALKEKEENNV